MGVSVKSVSSWSLIKQPSCSSLGKQGYTCEYIFTQIAMVLRKWTWDVLPCMPPG